MVIKKNFKSKFKYLLIALTAVVGILFLLPKAVSSIESNHVCENHDCAICEVIRINNDNNKQEIISPVETVTIQEDTNYYFVTETIFCEQTHIINTLVSYKTKISS